MLPDELQPLALTVTNLVCALADDVGADIVPTLEENCGQIAALVTLLAGYAAQVTKLVVDREHLDQYVLRCIADLRPVLIPPIPDTVAAALGADHEKEQP